MSDPSLVVTVVGAGLAGLSAAYEIRRAGATVTLLDAERRVGGVVLTERPETGWVVEGGPDGFLGSDPEIPMLAAELGIAPRLVEQRARGSLQWDGRVLAPLATGAAAGLLAIDTRDLDLSAGFRTFAGGMTELVDGLASIVKPNVGKVTAVVPSSRGFRIAVTGAMSLDCRAVVLAVPAYVAATLIGSLDESARDTLASVPYHPSTNVSLAYRREDVGHSLDASGFASAPEAAGLVRACTFASSKFPGRAPDGFVLLRAFMAPTTRDAASAAHEALAPVLRITARPLWARSYSWPRGLPRYEAGHDDRIAAARRRLSGFGPLVLAGGGYDGAGVSACVRSGRAAASEVLARV